MFMEVINMGIILFILYSINAILFYSKIRSICIKDDVITIYIDSLWDMLTYYVIIETYAAIVNIFLMLIEHYYNPEIDMVYKQVVNDNIKLFIRIQWLNLIGVCKEYIKKPIVYI